MFLDIGLPDASDYEIARMLRARETPAPHLVAITGWGSETDLARAFEAGFDQHVLEPIDAKIVQNVLGRASDALASATSR